MTTLTIPLVWFTLRIELLPAPRRASRRGRRDRLLVQQLSPHLLRDIGLDRR